MAKLIIELDDDILERYEDPTITVQGRLMLLAAQQLRLQRKVLSHLEASDLKLELTPIPKEPKR